MFHGLWLISVFILAYFRLAGESIIAEQRNKYDELAAFIGFTLYIQCPAMRIDALFGIV